jgi:hypothetical protein
MSSPAELMTQTHGPDAHRAEPASAASWAEKDTDPVAGAFNSFFGSTPPEPPVAATSRLVNHPLLAHPANRMVRAVALRRAQQTYGNRFVQRVVQRRCACGGTCEKCAAEVSAVAPQPVTEEDPKRIVQARAADDGLDADGVAMSADSAAQPLDPGTRRFMESRFGRDLADVRVHTDRPAAESASALGADAYTSGRDVYFAAGKYAPETAEGQHLLAHELAHTVQQADGRTPEAVAARASDGLIVGRPDDPMEEEAERAADAITSGVAGPAAVSADHTPAVRRQEAPAPEAKKDEGVLNYLSRKALEGAEATINYLAPGVVPLLRGIGAYLTEKITAGIDTLFGGLVTLVQKEGVVGALESLVGKALGGITGALGQLASGACQGLVAAASALLDLAKTFVGQQIEGLRRAAGAVGDFFEEAWAWLGLPDFEAIKKAAGRAWAFVEEQADWLWKKLEPVRKAGARFLGWLRETFELGLESADGLLESLRKKALAAWAKVKPAIQPILGPLKTVGTALFLLTPAGWTVLGAAAFWEGLRLAANVLGSYELKNAPAYLREHVLPLILAGANGAMAALGRVCSFLSKVTDDVLAAVGSVLDALGGTALLKLARQAVGAAASFFGKVAAVAKGGLCGLIEQGVALIRRYSGPIGEMLEALRQLALVVTLGPWAILDDGVWGTLNAFVTRAMKVPCLHEIGGFLHVPGALAQIGKARMFLKGAWRVLNNPEILKPEIDKALGGLVAKVPGAAKTVLAYRLFPGPDAERHLEGVWRFLEPKISGLLSDWQGLLLGILGDLIWPWPGVKKDMDAIGKSGDEFWAALSELHFSKAVDELLAIWRGLNSIAGHLTGWFTLASVLVGAVLGGIFGVGAGAGAGAAAGFAFAIEIGMPLVLSTIAAEELSIEKAQANLLLRSRRGSAAVPAVAPAPAGPAVPQVAGQARPGGTPRTGAAAAAPAPLLTPDEQDYQQIAESTFNLAILTAMMVLGEIAVEFAKSAWSEIKGAIRGAPREGAVPRPGAAEPAALPAEAPSAEGAGRPPAEPAEPLPEDTAARAEENGIPREQLEAEVGELRQKAADPTNVRRPADPRLDAEMDADGHTFDREAESRSWCRHSDGVCDLDLGGDLNAKVDAALEQRQAEAPKAGEAPEPTEEPKPVTQEPVGEADVGAPEIDPDAQSLAKADANAQARAEAQKLIKDGKFEDPNLEARYREYLKRKNQPAQKAKGPPRDRADWKVASDYMTQESPVVRGNRFNATRNASGEYRFSEVTLENGKRVDAYNEPVTDPQTGQVIKPGEIVSRKAVDFDTISDSTFDSYLDEFGDKYAPGTRINAPKFGKALQGKALQGEKILEVPETNKGTPAAARFEARAKARGVEIRYRPE